jgi:hypothetical protein
MAGHTTRLARRGGNRVDPSGEPSGVSMLGTRENIEYGSATGRFSKVGCATDRG